MIGLKLFWLQILKYGGVIIGILFVLFKTKQSGKEGVERKIAMEALKGVQKREEIKDSVDSASDIERKRLRNKWNRD